MLGQSRALQSDKLRGGETLINTKCSFCDGPPHSSNTREFRAEDCRASSCRSFGKPGNYASVCPGEAAVTMGPTEMVDKLNNSTGGINSSHGPLHPSGRVSLSIQLTPAKEKTKCSQMNKMKTDLEREKKKVSTHESFMKYIRRNFCTKICVM